MTSNELDQAAARAWFSPSGFYVGGEDNLRLRSLNAAAGVLLNCAGRIRGTDGVIRPFSVNQTPNTDRTVASTLSSIGEGWILNLRVAPIAGTPRIGQCWALVELVRGFSGATSVVGTLVSGYVTTNQPLAWPGSPMRGTLEGPGVIRSITGTDPAAGAEVSETVPTGARWRLIAMNVVLGTDATVANRNVTITIDDGVNLVYQGGVNRNQVASTTIGYSFGSGTGAFGDSLNAVLGSLPAPLVLLPGWRIATSTLGRVAGDNFGAPQLTVEEWLEGT